MVNVKKLVLMLLRNCPGIKERSRVMILLFFRIIILKLEVIIMDEKDYTQFW